jgi:hypothetical protein
MVADGDFPYQIHFHYAPHLTGYRDIIQRGLYLLF